MDFVDQSFTWFDNLDYGLITEILSRLPARTLVQLTSVCKLWYYIIKNPSFISEHLSRSGSDLSNSYIFIVKPNSRSVIVISDHNHVITRHPNYIIPFETRSLTYAVIDTCNGLICITDDEDEEYNGGDIYLLNPFINKYKKIGAESSCYSDLLDRSDGKNRPGKNRVCFWYCEVEKDYKILRILIRYRDCNVVVSIRYEIYSLNTDTWTVMEGIDNIGIYGCSPVYVNGCFYWSPAPWIPSGSLQCFDLKEKSYNYISLPTFSKNTYPDFRILAKDESLTLCVRRCVPSPCTDIPLPHTMYLYTLEKGINGNCWKELFHYKSHQLYIPDKCMGFSAAGRFIFCQCFKSETNIIALDIDKSCAVEKLALENQGDISMETTMAFNVFESLVLLST